MIPWQLDTKIPGVRDKTLDLECVESGNFQFAADVRRPFTQVLAGVELPAQSPLAPVA